MVLNHELFEFTYTIHDCFEFKLLYAIKAAEAPFPREGGHGKRKKGYTP